MLDLVKTLFPDAAIALGYKASDGVWWLGKKVHRIADGIWWTSDKMSFVTNDLEDKIHAN